MPIFKYKAKNNITGKTKSELTVGINEADVVKRLSRQNFSVLAIADKTDSLEAKINLFLNSIKVKDLVIFSRQFSVMIAANVPVVESLLILIDQTNNFSLKKMIADIAFEVDSGALLSDAFAKRPKIFSEFFVNIIKSGETSGKLDEVLTYLADETEKSYDMASKIKGAMIYPAFILVGLLAVAVILMVYVIPNLTSMLTETGMQLPLATRIIIAISNFLQNYLILLILTLVGLIIAVRYYLRTEVGRYQLDTFKLKMPIFGRLFKYIYLVRFSRTLSTLLKGGVTITRALEITANVVGNVVYRDLILATLESINDGNPLSTVMEASNDVPKMVPQMLSVGERTGRIDSVLDKITDFYGRESSAMLANLSTLMEPIIMVIMGVGVGIMVAAILMPMYNMANQF
ncbi:MAG TPA: type II secretion system F family protein [bacterium]|jgi:type IV pilus assembly protein PilC|nr:MAG: Type II secretion system protein F [Parcubacteria group bacterium ADurb.Bin115]HOD87129.1 type II secretion system F family protein [bacterium]HPW05777.1 type II secretion system F family protein [bacterium]HPY99504.1 type II secretion system F family protein [bacterium]HQB76499.1 type II secretion system F family protein [bacterium]